MIGYKAFNNNWTCRGFKYEVGKTYRMENIPKCCTVGFHFCKKISDCFDHYSLLPETKVALVESRGAVVTKDGKKFATNVLRIIKEISWKDVLNLVNTGDYNEGRNNTGDHNIGDRNSGSWNDGYSNTGNWNTGSINTGDTNIGNRNAGNYNKGDWNTGDRNTGSYNSGYLNKGHHNTGDRNTGSYNSGYLNKGRYNSGEYNTGDWNTGNRNNGHLNTGHYNNGNCNTGNWNTGHWNTGDWNNGNGNNGCFNTERREFFMFNKPCSWTYSTWYSSYASFILNQCPVNIEERQYWYDNLIESGKITIKSLPNFDAKIFKQITGIDVNKGYQE